ncbi:MAG: hypothetical protein M0Z78_03115 [Betaproteobacteria bacterium]|nr:hypothetical protein [Betaproteobacteria bacterium]
MHIDARFNLVIPVGALNIYHTPISREVFEANYLLLAATKSSIASKGIHYAMDSGPRIASLLLRDEARKEVEDKGPSFFLELARLSIVLVPTENGWEKLPVELAINSGKLDLTDWKEVESSIVFFTCYFSMARKAEREGLVRAIASLLGWSTTSLNLSEWSASLPSLIQTQSTQPTLSETSSTIAI